MNRLASPRQRLPGYALGGDVWDGGSSYGGTGTNASSANNGSALAGNAADMTNQGSGSGYNLGLAGAAPSVTALAGLAGADPSQAGMARGAFSGMTSAIGPVGMALSAGNMVANGINAYGNYGTLAGLNTPMSLGQAFSALAGNQYSGTTAQALAAMGDQIGPNKGGPNPGGPNADDIAAAQLAGPTETVAPRVDIAQTQLSAPAPNPTSSGPEVAAGSDAGADQGGGGDNGAGQGGNGAEQGGGAFAVGGLVTQGVTNRSTRALRHVSGLVAGHSPGTSDVIAATVPENSYVIPADVVAAMGGGNTLAGAATLDKSRAAHSTAPGPSQGHAMLDIRLSAGEYLIRADHVASIGGGDLARGHQALDTIVRGVRTNAIQHLQEKLSTPPPQ